MEHCFFAKEPPEIEVRGRLVFLRPKDGHAEIAVEPATLAAFVATANQALDQIYEQRRAGVVRLKTRR